MADTVTIELPRADFKALTQALKVAVRRLAFEEQIARGNFRDGEAELARVAKDDAQRVLNLMESAL